MNNFIIYLYSGLVVIVSVLAYGIYKGFAVYGMRHKLYWFLYNHFVRQWNDFKDFIGHPSDPLWVRWLADILLDADTLYDKDD